MVRHYGDMVYVQMVKDEDGTYVEYADYAERVGRMQQAVKDEQKRLGVAITQVTENAEVTRLRAEVERLTKAGDMCDQLLACFEMEGRKGVNIGRDMWREAKNGKPKDEYNGNIKGLDF